MSPTRKAQLQLHFCVLLWSFTAIFGKLITLSALSLVWWRMLLVVAILIITPRIWRNVKTMPWRVIAIYAGIGTLVAMHWLAFYASIKQANASVGATCLALVPVFLAFIEPWIMRHPFKIRDVLLGIAVIPGVLLIAGGVGDSMRIGIALGVLAAFLSALFAALNKYMAKDDDPLTITCIELGAGTVFLTAVIALTSQGNATFVVPDMHNAALLLALSIGCTLLPFTLWLFTLKHLSAFSSQIAICLEPVYAILLAMLLLNEQEQLNISFYIGSGIILAAIGIHPLISKPHNGGKEHT